ncbi:hypothetical protein D1007_52199 [Hordeum vulgare]|nr:hypothetical protein D1007_52199 [Hordeum vulgare]
MEQDVALGDPSRDPISSSIVSHFFLMAKASKLSPTLNPNISHDDNVDDNEDEDNDEESDNVASLKIKGEMIFKSLYKNKLACSNFMEIMSIASEGKKYIEELEAHLEEHEATIETIYGNEADKFNGGRSTGQGLQHGGRPLDFEGNVNADRSGSGDRDANGSASHRLWKGLKDNNLYDPWNHAWLYYGGFDCMYCNLKHKGGGATRVAEHLGGIVDFIYKEIEKVVEEIGHEHIVQIVTDNGSNCKKACKTLIEEPKYSHIVWQPCAAHTVNLMLKDIAKSPEVDVIAKSAKTIYRFMHKHNNLHDNMKKNIGGELIRPNATSFGTVFMFLDSYHSKKDKFREWMVSKDWKECQWRYEPGYVFAEECLSSNVWWNALEWVLGSLRPLYMAMRYADTQKQCTLSGFKKRMMLAIQKMEAHLGPTSRLYLTFMRKVGKRIDAMEEDTFMVATAVLDPYTHYKLNLCNHTDYATSLTDAIVKILDPVSALSAIDEIRAEEDEGKERDIDKEIDPSALLMDTTMFDETNPIMEWLNEDVEDPIMDGADVGSAVFEKIRHLNSSRKASYVGSKGSNKKRKRSDDDENEFFETESEDDDGENEYVDNDIEDDDAVSEDDEDGLQDQLETQMQLEEETQVQVEKDTTSIGNLETRRSGRLARKKTKHVNSLYS